MIKYSDCLVHLLLHWSLTDYIHQRKWLIAQSLITSHLEFAEYFEHKTYVLCWRKSKNTFTIKSKSIKTAKWRAIGLKCDCHNLMLLDIWMCLVVWSNNYGIRLHQIILCLEDMFQVDHVLLYLLWTDFYSFRLKKENHYCTDSNNFTASGTRISATTVGRRFRNSVLQARGPVVCVHWTEIREVPGYTLFCGTLMIFMLDKITRFMY